MMPRTITDPELAKLWRIHPNTLPKWHSANLLVSDGRHGSRRTHWYFHTTIEAIHRASLVSPDLPLPSVATLLALQEETGGPVLLTVEEAATRLGQLISSVRKAIKMGSLVALKPPGNSPRWLIPLPSLIAYEQLRSDTDVVALELAARILGVIEESVRELYSGASPRLERVHISHMPQRVFIGTASLMDFIGQQLARRPDGKTWLTPQAWRAMRIRHNYEELLTVLEIKHRFRTHYRTVHRLIDIGVFPCLYTAGGQARVPLHAVAAWAAPRQQIKVDLVTKTLAVTPAVAEQLIVSRALCTREHGPRSVRDCPTMTCYEAYLTANRTNETFTAAEWLTWCRQDGTPIITATDYLAYHPNVSRADLDAAIEDDTMRGIRLPDGTEIALLQQDASILTAKVRQFLNLLSRRY